MPRPAASADPFLAVADPTRRAILDLLRDGEAPVTRHLRILREAQLVRERRVGTDGRQRVYQLTPGPLREISRWASGYEKFWQTSLTRLQRHVEQRSQPGTRERKPR